MKRIYAPRFLFKVDNLGLEIPEVRTQATPIVEPAPIARETNRTRELIALNSRVGLKADFLNAFVPAIGCYHPHLNVRAFGDEGKLAPVGLHYVGMGKH